MPFVSKAQRAYLYKNHPDIAERWAKETPKNAPLPERKGKTRNQKAQDKLKRGMLGKYR